MIVVARTPGHMPCALLDCFNWTMYQASLWMRIGEQHEGIWIRWRSFPKSPELGSLDPDIIYICCKYVEQHFSYENKSIQILYMCVLIGTVGSSNLLCNRKHGDAWCKIVGLGWRRHRHPRSSVPWPSISRTGISTSIELCRTMDLIWKKNTTSWLAETSRDSVRQDCLDKQSLCNDSMMVRTSVSARFTPWCLLYLVDWWFFPFSIFFTLYLSGLLLAIVKAIA